ncbi:MAG: hypothetical protein Q8N05_19620 [Bacteroidota bacterium]|nr:hypothetical protein [Bacteroidota bacterium]
MKRERLLIPVVLIALAIGFTACNKDNTNSSTSGNSNLGIKLQALNKSFSMPVASVGLKSATITTASITWDAASMIVSSVKFEAKLKSVVTHHDSIEINYKWSGPKEIDLLDPLATVGNFVLQQGFYDEIEIKVNGSKQDAGDKSVFYLHGVYNKDNLTALPVMVKVNEDVMFKTEKDSVDITATSSPVFSSIIQLYLDKLMVDIQLSALDNATLTDGTIVISANSNTELYKIVIRNLVKNHHWEHGNGHGEGDGHM